MHFDQNNLTKNVIIFDRNLLTYSFVLKNPPYILFEKH